MRRTVPPSAEIEGRIDELLAGGIAVDDAQGALSELAALGARLIIQRAVEDEFDAWLGRARYERKPEAPQGKRNGYRPRRVQAAEGELRVEVPQVREAAEHRSAKEDRAKDFLRGLVTDAPVLSSEIRKAAKAAHLA